MYTHGHAFTRMLGHGHSLSADDVLHAGTPNDDTTYTCTVDSAETEMHLA